MVCSLRWQWEKMDQTDRKSTRLNSSHLVISYAVFCLKKYSIFPPNCKLISRSEGLKHMKPGQVAFTVISENSTKEAHRLIAASIGLALPSDKSMYGYLSEHHSFGETEEVAGQYAEELAAEMLATTLNVEFDPDLSFDEKKEVYRISNKIVRTMNVTQSAVGDKRGFWTTVLGAAILIGEDD